jgi:cullin-associated NEDD8-dissociated protein 1
VITLLLRTAPQEAYPLIEATILPSIYSSAVSPSLTANLLDSLLDFFGSLVAADPPIANRLVLSLTLALDQVGSGPGSAANTSKCIAAVIRNEITLAAGTISDFAKAIKVSGRSLDARQPGH